MPHQFSNYPGDPPEPSLNLTRATQPGTCAGCGFTYASDEIVDGTGTEVYCNACVESEQPGSTADFLNPCSREVEDGWDYPEDVGPITYGSLNREEPDHDDPDEDAISPAAEAAFLSRFAIWKKTCPGEGHCATCRMERLGGPGTEAYSCMLYAEAV